jgi:NAD kinase
MEDAFEKYLDGSLRVGERLLLRVNVHREDEVIWNSTALNDLLFRRPEYPSC